jgi:UDP-N-acetylglucosamine--N-acetylmuramyl-(pentapeptide) pyrophosphoryl-undecaprenol N-acetylglucosamine transferase
MNWRFGSQMEPDAAQNPLFVFAGGGTGGHLFPGIAVGEALKELVPDSRILFLHTGRPVEESVLADAGFETLFIPPIRTRDLLKHPLRFASAFLKATRECKRIVKDRQPAAIIGLGGVASVPLIRVARNRTVVLLEQNVLPGRTTRWLAKRHPVLMSFERTRTWLPNPHKHIVTGNPVARSIANLFRPETPLPKKNCLLILGGSQGSSQVNEAVLSSVSELRDELKSYTIIHQTGSSDCERVRGSYQQLGLRHEVQEFFTDMADVYSKASIVVARSGATTLAELAIAGIPAIFIPYPNAKDDHQTINAQQFVESGAALLVDSHHAAHMASDLSKRLKSLIADDTLRKSMAGKMRSLATPDAARNVAREILERVHSVSGEQL